MALADAIAGGLRPSQVITWIRSGTTPEPLTGATLTGKIKDRSSGAARNIEGALTVIDGAGGVFRWDYAAADVATAGAYHVQFTASFGDAPTPARTQTAEWRVWEVIT